MLADAYRGRESAFVPVYGRRRVGKSELILRFLGDKQGVYFVGKTAPAGLQKKEFLQEAARSLKEPLLEGFAPDRGWKEILTAVTKAWKGRGKLVLALDEFQWTAAQSPELPSVLQELWDREWKPSGNVVLILCGSFVGFMEREILGRTSPLFGRRTAQILLRPFSYREAALFHPRWSVTDRASVYFLCGGVPAYLRFFDAAVSIEQNLQALLLDEFGPLFREPEFLLREELRDVESYYAVLRAIASGHTDVRSIAKASGIAERSLHYYLAQLVDIGYVARRHPMLRGRRPRRVRFVLDDSLLRFWFRFVFPNLTFLQQMGPRRLYRERIRPEMESYYGSAFERLCREALPFLYAEEGVTAGFEIGEYWDRDVQIDVVGLRDDGWLDLGECKWGKQRSAQPVINGLAKKVAAYPNPGGDTIQRRIFTRHDLPTPRQALGVKQHTLADLYGGAG